jgi:hypothetical protein
VIDDVDLPTPRTTLAARYVRVMLTCWHCRHQADADLTALIAAGRGDVPLTRLRWRCALCRSDRIDMVVTSRDVVVPWQAHPSERLNILLRTVAPPGTNTAT